MGTNQRPARSENLSRAFFLLQHGRTTVMLAATLFGSKELKLETSQLIGVILVITARSHSGAYIMAKLSDMFGNLRYYCL